MKKVLFTLVLGSLAAAAFAQQTNTPPANTVVAGTHIITPNNTPACYPGTTDTGPAPTNATPITIALVNPNAVAGVQARLTYDPAVVQIIDPAGTCYEGAEGKNIAITVSPSVVVNYSKAAQGEVFFAIASSQGASTGGTLLTLLAQAKGAAGATSTFAIDPAKFVVAGAAGSGKNAVDGKFIIGAPGEGEVPTGAAQGSVTTDGTNIYAVNDQGILSVATAADPGLAFVETVGPVANRIGAPVMGRPVAKDGKIVAVGSNGKIQVFNGTAPYAATLAPAKGPTLGAGVTVSATPAVANNKIFFPDSSGAMWAFNLDGSQAATAAAGASPTSSPAYVTSATGTRVVVGGGNAVLVLNEDLTPVTGITIPATGAVSSSPYVGPDGVGWVGTDDGKVITFSVGAVAGPVGTATDAGGPVRAPIFGSALGAIAVNTSGKITVVSPLGAAVGAGATLTPPAGSTVPAGQDLFGFQQSPIVRGTTMLIGDSIGNLYQASVDAAGTIGAPTTRNFGSLPITALASPTAGKVDLIVNRANVLQANYTP